MSVPSPFRLFARPEGAQMTASELLFDQVSDGVPLSRKVVDRITEAVSRGQLKPGDRLPTEREMAVQFGVSRTAIRDAIKLLAGQGMLEVRRGAGIFISSREHVADRFADLLRIREGSIGDLFEIRKLIEVEAAGWAAERGTSEQVERIDAILDQARGAKGDPATLARLDAEFHLTIAEAARNAVLLRIMQNLLDLLASGRQESLRIKGRPEQSVGEHERIGDAIRQRDAAGARHAMWEHLDSVERSIRRHLQQGSPRV